jgi:hypothetical protein
MAELPDDLLEEVGKSRVGGGGNYIQHGDYIFMINRWFYQKIQDRCIILENLVIESRKKAVMEGKNKVEDEPNPVGSTCSDTANFDGDGKLSAPANSRAPVLGLYGFKEGTVPDDKVKKALAKATSDAQPMAGMLVACTTFPKEIRSNKGNYITGRTYSCVAVPGQGVNTEELARARMAAYKSGGAEAAVKLALEHLKAARAKGEAASLPSSEEPKTEVAATTAPGDSVPDLEDETPEIPDDKPAVDPLAGWTIHPKSVAKGDADPYYFKGKELKRKSQLLA